MCFKLITGGAGFIGSHLASQLLSNGQQVIILDNLVSGFKNNVPAKSLFVQHDICNEFPQELEQYKIDTVFHLAAQSSGENSFYEPDRDVSTNVMGTMQTLKFCHKHDIKRILCMSSMSVYGEPKEKIVAEKTLPHPCSIYGSTKLASEHVARVFCQHHNIALTNLRLFSTFGPGQDLNNLKQGIVSIYLYYLLHEDKILVKGSLDRFRDLVYIDDVVEALIRVAKEPKTWGKTINLGTGKKITVKIMLETLKNAAGKNAFPVEIAPGTPGDTHGIVADISKLESLLQWRPQISAIEGIKKMTDFYLERLQ